MTFLLEISWLRAVAEWIWNDTNNVEMSAELCVLGLPWSMSGVCASRLMAKVLGIGIILGACINKTPMIANLWQTKSAEGLSKQGLYGEVLLLVNSALYGMLEQHPFTAYGENICLLIQSVVIVVLFWQFSDSPVVSVQERYLLSFGSVVYIAALALALPAEWHSVLVAVSWPVLIYSRGLQIGSAYQAKHTGAQSPITLTLNVVGTTIRIFTTLAEVGWNYVLLCQFGLGLLANGTLLAQYIWYQKNTAQFRQTLLDKQQQKAKQE